MAWQLECNHTEVEGFSLLNGHLEKAFRHKAHQYTGRPAAPQYIQRHSWLFVRAGPLALAMLHSLCLPPRSLADFRSVFQLWPLSFISRLPLAPPA